MPCDIGEVRPLFISAAFTETHHKPYITVAFCVFVVVLPQRNVVVIVCCNCRVNCCKLFSAVDKVTYK